MNSKKLWYFLMINALVLWGGVIVLGHYLFPEGRLNSWIPFLFILGIHGGEVPVARKIGREKKLSVTRTIVKTILFGFTWWVPLKKGIIDK